MRLFLVADAYPPITNSCAIQVSDLVTALDGQGHQVNVLTPDSSVEQDYLIEKIGDGKIIRLFTPAGKSTGRIKRAISELLMPFFMIRNLQRSKVNLLGMDGLIWYSPSIFFAPLIAYLKFKSSCKTYLIIRDIFPQWALDIGILRKGFAYYFFKIFEYWQYSLATTVGVQSKGNLKYFESLKFINIDSIEVLENWLSPEVVEQCSINCQSGPMAGKFIFLYAGNMGIAQCIENLLVLAEDLLFDGNIGFLLVGKGGEVDKLKAICKSRNLTNVCILDEVLPSEMPALYKQCNAGLIALDPRHRTHNIPGKFLSYMRSGLPVFAIVNPNNDIIELINEAGVGKAFAFQPGQKLKELALDLVEDLKNGVSFEGRAKGLFEERFTSALAAKKIINALSK